jgi:hypothetical protein
VHKFLYHLHTSTIFFNISLSAGQKS